MRGVAALVWRGTSGGPVVRRCLLNERWAGLDGGLMSEGGWYVDHAVEDRPLEVARQAGARSSGPGDADDGDRRGRDVAVGIEAEAAEDPVPDFARPQPFEDGGAA